jgi:hypothetical protein
VAATIATKQMKTGKKVKAKYGSLQSPIKLVGIPPIHCFITEEGKRVIEVQSLQKAIGYDGKSELWLLNLLISLSKFEEVSEKILHAYNHPKKLEISHLTKESIRLLMIDHKTFYATLILLVKAKNDGLLSASQIKYAKNAESILKQLDKTSLKKIINQASGLTLLKDRNKAYIQNLVRQKQTDDSLLWMEHLPNYFYEKILKLEGLTWANIEKSPERMIDIFLLLFHIHIPQELHQKMTSQKPKRIYQKKHNRPKNQVFTELESYLNDLISLMDQSVGDRFIFNQLLSRKFPAKTLTPSLKTTAKSTVNLSRFNLVLQKIIQ